MSFISATTGLPVPGLKNATGEQKWACSKDKIINNLKHSAVYVGTGAAVGGTTYAILTNGKVQKAAITVVDKTKNLIGKVANKLGKSEAFTNTITEIKEVLGKTGLTTKAGKVGLAIAGITLLGATISTVAYRHQIHTNGKIEGKHQAQVDMANGTEA